MFVKSVLLFLALGSVVYAFYNMSDVCPTPRLAHGRVRMRQRSRLVRFTCLPRYELVGNKYATCRNGKWDVPLPVCVRPSCHIPVVQNGLSMMSHGGAWVIFFCFPNHELVGSPVIYCDGNSWNGSAPICQNTTAALKLSCDFEEPDLCGWKQDALHDFDWTRLNSKTPSSFLFTGPSYDHTLGKGKDGYFMYIESTSQVQNDTARLISPVYEGSLTLDGCFSFSYHMYGKTCGGLRVYQKPDNLTMKKLLEMSEEEKQTYVLFEKWGNLGDNWFNSVSPLNKMSIDFQIVIEGIRGSSYTSDIAIDDVAILQGENCTAAEKYASTPPTPTTTVSSSSCVNRCIDEYVAKSANDTECSCSFACIVEENCCADFFGECVFSSDSITPDVNVNVTGKTIMEDAPQTQKLVASTLSTTSTASTTITPIISTATLRLTIATPKTTVIIPSPISPPTPKSTPKPTSPSTTSTVSTTTSTKPTTTRKLTTSKPSSTYITTKIYKENKTTTQQVIPLKTTAASTKTISTTTVYKASKPIDNDNYLESVEKAKKEQNIENEKVVKEVSIKRGQVKVLPQTGEMSTTVKVVIIILVLAMVTMLAMVVNAGLRSTRLRITLARLRGHRNRDPEVRYLSSDVDDD